MTHPTEIKKNMTLFSVVLVFIYSEPFKGSGPLIPNFYTYKQSYPKHRNDPVCML